MTEPSEIPVLVVGAGPVGLTMAAELARQGVACRIVDHAPAAPSAGSRAVAIQARTLEIFADMGVVAAILESGHRIHGANLFAEGSRIFHFSFDELASPFPFAIDLPQPETERVITAHLRRFGFEVERSATLTGLVQDEHGVTARLDTPDGPSVIRAKYLIGCDGAHSSVRQLAAIPDGGSPPHENYLIADLPVEWDTPDDEWNFWFHEDGLFNLFPLGSGRYRMIADADAGAPADSAQVASAFERRGPRNAVPGEPVWAGTFRTNRRQALSYQCGRVFVAGDAAHVQSPAGGQGMNTGIQDAYNLAWKLGMVFRGNAPESLLESYGAERQPVGKSMLALTSNMDAIAAMRHPISQGVRNRLLPILAGFEVFEQRIASRLAEISVNYRRSPIVGQSGRWYGSGPNPGDRAVDAPVGSGKRVFDLLGGTRHAVLIFTAEHPGEDDLRNLSNLERYMRDGYPREVSTHVISRAELPGRASTIIDSGGAAHHAYAAGVPCIYLVRPDGYVGFRGLTTDPLPLLEHLNRVYEPPMEEVPVVS